MDALREVSERYRRRVRANLSPTQRLELFAQLQIACMRQVRATPEGWQSFLRRNLKKRAVSPVSHER